MTEALLNWQSFTEGSLSYILDAKCSPKAYELEVWSLE